MSIEIRFKNSDEESYNIQEQDWMIRRIIPCDSSSLLAAE